MLMFTQLMYSRGDAHGNKFCKSPLSLFQCTCQKTDNLEKKRRSMISTPKQYIETRHQVVSKKGKKKKRILEVSSITGGGGEVASIA